ncbi:unnamed protein product [Soboliphyme baturini]|uniref:Uncharacterized protein n=1 Tax=Soboliphyme baturini TaxID=241478 RepID=A0A183ILE0_9BILA|nr:unnamed protein product [Soboliphyme baturini]
MFDEVTDHGVGGGCGGSGGGGGGGGRGRGSGRSGGGGGGVVGGGSGCCYRLPTACSSLSSTSRAVRSAQNFPSSISRSIAVYFHCRANI